MGSARRWLRSVVALCRKGGSVSAQASEAAVREADPPVAEAETEASEMTYLEAICDALRTEMRRDDSVICFGEDIAAFGGAFKVTDGFLEEFGARRVIDAPL